MDLFRNIRDNGILKVANSAARLALLPTNGDIVEQLDDNSLWAWNAVSQTWIQENGGIPVYATLADFPVSASPGSLAIAEDTGIVYEFISGSWIPVAGPGFALAIGTIDSGTPSSNGAHIDLDELIMQSASISVPGLVNTTTQSFVGHKTFTGILSGANSTVDDGSGNANFGSSVGAPMVSGAFFQVEGAGIATIRMQQGTATTYNFNLPDNAGTAGYALTSQGGIGAPMTWTLFQSPGNYITALTGDGAATGPGSVAFTLATVNTNTGSFGSSTAIPSFTVNGKGLITAASTSVVIAPAGTLTGTVLASNVVTSSLTSLGTQAQALNMGSHQINFVTDPSSAQDAATKAYVDAAVSALNPAAAVYAATVGSNIAGTYLNGVSGVGATFTTTASTTFTLDGTTPPLLSRILIKDQSSGFQNGIYTFTTAPVGGVSGAVFTRALDYNTASDMNSAGLIPVINGTLNALSSWQQVATITNVGVDSLVFTEFTANPSLYLLKANNLSDVSSKTTSFNNLSPMTTGGDLIYGGTSGTGTRLANGSSGQLLQSNGTTLAPTWVTPPTASTDIPPTVWVGPANNTANQSITGLTFSNSILSFEALVNIAITATSNTWTTVKLIGTRQAAANWGTNSIQAEIDGDTIVGLAFNITSTGQVQISTGSTAGYVSASTKFRAITL